MAVSLLSSHEISDLCIGKPALRCLPAIATVADALSSLKRSGDGCITVWSCQDPPSSVADGCTTAVVPPAKHEDSPEWERCRCLGKVSMVDVICFLCRDDNLSRPLVALESPVSALLQQTPELVKHLDPDSCLLEAIDCILGGVQNLIIPLKSRKTQTQKCNLCHHHPSFGPSINHYGHTYCSITQEDVVRFFLNSIHHFSPTPTQSIEYLNIINHDVVALHYDDPALPQLPAIQMALTSQMAIAIVNHDDKLVGEIAPHTFACCDESVSAAIATLTAGDLMAYIDCRGPPDDLVQLVKARLEDKNMLGMLELLEDEISALSPALSMSSPSYSSSSSDDEFGIERNGKAGSGNFSGRVTRSTEAVICSPGSSLVAVMIQALAHRVSYAWVVEADYTVVGMVTFSGMLKALREQISGFS